METLKNTNYDLLLRLGFDRDFIDENKRLGLREQQAEDRKIKAQYMLEYERQRKAYQSQVYERPEDKKDYLIESEENDDYKFVQITPPPKDVILNKDLVPISSLPPWAQKAFGSTKQLNTI